MVVKKDDAPPTVVFKLDLHCYCEGCAIKIEKTVRDFPSVVNVKVDMSAKKLTVIGKVDPAKVQDALAEKNKKVEIDCPQPKKDAADGNKGNTAKKPKENELTEVKREVKEKEEPLKLQKLEIQETTTVIQVEEKSQEAEHARNEAERARNVADRARNEAERARNVAERAQNEADRAQNEADRARNEAERAQNVACIAQNKLIKAEKDLQEKLEQTQMLKLKYQETNVRATYER